MLNAKVTKVGTLVSKYMYMYVDILYVGLHIYWLMLLLLQPITLAVTFSKVSNSKLERLFCHVSVKRDFRALSCELWNRIRKCHRRWDWLYFVRNSLVALLEALCARILFIHLNKRIQIRCGCLSVLWMNFGSKITTLNQEIQDFCIRRSLTEQWQTRRICDWDQTDWSCFYYFVRNRLVALLEAICYTYHISESTTDTACPSGAKSPPRAVIITVLPLPSDLSRLRGQGIDEAVDAWDEAVDVSGDVDCLLISLLRLETSSS